MIKKKKVTTDRVWLRDEFNDALDRFDEQRRLSAFLEATPNGSAIAQYLKHKRNGGSPGNGPEYRFFYDASSQKADYVAVWAGIEKYPTVIRHTVDEVTPDEAKQIDQATTSVTRCSPAQFGWAVAEFEIERHAAE